MALRKVYTVAVSVTSVSHVEVYWGVTIARSKEQVHDIIRRHVASSHRFRHSEATAGPSNPDEACRIVADLERLGGRWLDPRKDKREWSDSGTPDVVRLIMTGDAAC